MKNISALTKIRIVFPAYVARTLLIYFCACLSVYPSRDSVTSVGVNLRFYATSLLTARS